MENKRIPWNKGKKGLQVAWNKNKKMSIQMVKKITGKNNHEWKGNKVGYFGLHKWINRILGKPKYCAYCQNTSLKSRQYHWANISKAYKRDLSDWVRLCAKCHSDYDNNKINL